MKKLTNGFVRSFNIKISSNVSNIEVCKDEYLAAIIQNPQITEEEIKKLPNSANIINIMLKEFAHSLYEEYQKVLKETESQIQSEATKYAEYAA